MTCTWVFGMTDDMERLARANGELCDRINKQSKRIQTLENLLQTWLDVDCDSCPWRAGWHTRLCEHYDQRTQACKLIVKTKQVLANRHDD